MGCMQSRPNRVEVVSFERSKVSGRFRPLQFNQWVSGHPVWDSGPTPRDLSNETAPILFGSDCIDPILLQFQVEISDWHSESETVECGQSVNCGLCDTET